jgi:hypothetical protein
VFEAHGFLIGLIRDIFVALNVPDPGVSLENYPVHKVKRFLYFGHAIVNNSYLLFCLLQQQEQTSIAINKESIFLCNMTSILLLSRFF